jgi:hypothetical protein
LPVANGQSAIVIDIGDRFSGVCCGYLPKGKYHFIPEVSRAFTHKGFVHSVVLRGLMAYE